MMQSLVWNENKMNKIKFTKDLSLGLVSGIIVLYEGHFLCSNIMDGVIWGCGMGMFLMRHGTGKETD